MLPQRLYHIAWRVPQSTAIWNSLIWILHWFLPLLWRSSTTGLGHQRWCFVSTLGQVTLYASYYCGNGIIFIANQAISFAYLQTQKDPVIENVSAWPGQSDDPTRTTTVTAIYYDKNNTPRSYGTATQMVEIKERARKEGWLLVDSFKRHINNLSDVVPTEGFLQTDVHKLILPDNVLIGTVYAHWIKYLFGHAISIFIAKYSKEVWDKLKHDIEVVFTVPNGWYIQEHGVLVNAALEAKIIQKPAQANFVSETEAIVHWALMSRGLSLEVGSFI